MLKAIVRACLLVALVMGGSAAAARADVVDDIKERGTLIVGSKADYKPYGFLDPSGKIVGLEPDLAADVAKKPGVKLELVPVVSSNRMQFLQQGKIDLLHATMSDTEERRQVVMAVDPNYSSPGPTIQDTRKSGFKKGKALKDK